MPHMGHERIVRHRAYKLRSRSEPRQNRQVALDVFQKLGSQRRVVIEGREEIRLERIGDLEAKFGATRLSICKPVRAEVETAIVFQNAGIPNGAGELSRSAAN